MTEEVAELIENAVLSEREACAAICDLYSCDYTREGAEVCAEEIRKRTSKRDNIATVDAGYYWRFNRNMHPVDADIVYFDGTSVLVLGIEARFNVDFLLKPGVDLVRIDPPGFD